MATKYSVYVMQEKDNLKKEGLIIHVKNQCVIICDEDNNELCELSIETAKLIGKLTTENNG